MRTRRVATPAWVKATLILLAVGLPTWWLADRHDRVVNQNRLAAIAGEIAGSGVKVRCPGPVARVFGGWDLYEGSVRFDADGTPGDEAKLRETTCAELDALAEGDRDAELACAERNALACGTGVRRLARAVDTVTHEAFHLRGIMDEAVTECRSLQSMHTTAQRLGATEAQGRALARLVFAVDFPLMPARYRLSSCRVA
jgi:hypothetical protein